MQPNKTSAVAFNSCSISAPAGVADAAAQLKALDASWSDAKARYTGDDWASSWTDWEKRIAALKTKMKAK